MDGIIWQMRHLLYILSLIISIYEMHIRDFRSMYKSRYEGDLVAKCYFPKHNLVWEVLDGCLKNKIEIPWYDIMALMANYPEDALGTLEVVLKVYSGLGTLPLTLPYSSFMSNS
ncbi:hypothetical protein RIF29_15708 [Crotalaria pallida]|uniref:TRF2/HOY1 PH-like domain-containing protein n=1 Tax=Crotalaria pallida TaxID=3830 RepID=A0AAN9ICU6_CROPI